MQLHASNIAYGYKEVYKTKVIDFGASGACNINVLCPLGNGWEAERNSVALVLNAPGQSWCSGAMVMNTCNTGQPFFLTANHCYAPPGQAVQNVGAWRFTFQAWSPACTPSQNANDATITLTGSGNVVVTATAGAFSDSRTYTGNYNTAYNGVATGLQTSSPYYPYGPSSYYGYYINFTPIPGVTTYHMEWFDVTTNSLLNTYPITYTGTNSVFYYYFTSGHTYRYRLAALSPCGTKGPFSAWSGDMLPPPPPAASCATGPYGSTLSQARGCGTSGTGCPYINLSWPAITGAVQYKIEYNVFNTSTGYTYPTSTSTTSYTSNPVYTSVPIPVVSGTGWYLKYRVSVNCGSGFGAFSGWSATFLLQ